MRLRLVSIMVVLFIGTLILPFLITKGAAEYTLPVVWSNKKSYDPSEMAYLFGYGFRKSTSVTVTITRPDLVEDTVQTSTDEFGYFACQYLLDGIHGTFQVRASDGVNSATTAFENCLYLDAWWKNQDSIYIYAQAGGLSKNKQYYIKYFDPAGVERRQSPTYTGVISFTDNLTVLPTFPNIFGQWTIKLYENGALKKTAWVYINRIVWTTDSTYTVLVTSFARGQTVYFKTMGLQTSKYYRFKLEMPNGTKFFVGSWTTGVTQMTGSYVLPSNAPLGTWTLHVREADNGAGANERHYVDCKFQVTTAYPPVQYYLTVQTDPSGIGTIPGQGWYCANTIVNLTAPEYFAGSTGVRYRFYYWDVDGTGKGIGVYGISICMNTSHTATAHYITQYFLTLTTNPSGVTTPAGINWYDSGTYASVFAPEFVGISPGASRYAFNGWTTGDMSEIADPSATSTTVFMDKAKTVVANYKTQYFVSFTHTGLDLSATGTVVTVNGSAKTYAQLSYDSWIDSGSVITYSYNTIVSSSTSGKRFYLTSVSGPSSPVTVTSTVTVTGNYKTQYQITVTASPAGAIGGTFKVTYTQCGTTYTNVQKTTTWVEWVDSSTAVTVSQPQDPINGLTGTRYKFDSYNPSSSVTMDQAKTVTLVYKTQYYLTVTSLYGTPSGQGWYDSGSSAYASLDTGIVDHGNGTRRVFVNWNGDASGTNYALSNPILMNGPKTATAIWKKQYYLNVPSSPPGVTTPSGTGWYDVGTYASISALEYVPGGSRYRFAGWITANMSEITDPSSPSTTVLVDEPKTVTANYVHQYLLTFSHTGLSSDANSAVVTVNGSSKMYVSLPYDLWADENSVVTYSYETTVSSSVSGKRYQLDSVTGPSSPITVTGDATIAGNYVIQYYLTVSSSYGSPIPASGWSNAGTPITASVTSPWSGPTGTRYLCTGWTGVGSVPASGSASSVGFTLNAPSSVTWNWKTQYLLTVLTNPSGLSPQPTRNPLGEAGPANSWWYDASTVVTLTAQPVTGREFDYWKVDDISKGDGVNPITATMGAPHTAVAYYTSGAFLVSINPMSDVIYVGDSVTFTSAISGGTSPYSFQWYVNGSPAPGATSSSWTLSPPSEGVYYVYLKVTDAGSNTAQSGTASITVHAPIGGYSVSLAKPASYSNIIAYTTLVALFSVVLSVVKRKRK